MLTFDVNRNFAHRLSPVSVEDDTFLVRDPANFGDWMDRSNLIVSVHDRDQDSLVRNRLAHVVWVNHPVLVYLEISDRRLALALQRAATIEDCLMLSDAGDNVIALVLVEVEHALDGEIIGFGRTAGKDDLLGFGVDQVCNLITRLVN